MALLHHRESDGTWSRTEVDGPGAILTLASIEATIPLSETYRNTEVTKQTN
ncbi:MAG TPA: hypothetical protein VE863_13860 [Pyrinomonadaceae bacterium]|jgi:hypothetical protein|nr:hypothetical protein [Pyrinomonadaceae bacterium]